LINNRGGRRQAALAAVPAHEAVQLISSGDRVFVHGGSAVPGSLLSALLDRSSELRDVELVHLHLNGAVAMASAAAAAPHPAPCPLRRRDHPRCDGHRGGDLRARLSSPTCPVCSAAAGCHRIQRFSTSRPLTRMGSALSACRSTARSLPRGRPGCASPRSTHAGRGPTAIRSSTSTSSTPSSRWTNPRPRLHWQARHRLPQRQPPALRLRRRQPDARDAPGRLHQRHPRHLASRQHGRHQLGARDRPRPARSVPSHSAPACTAGSAAKWTFCEEQRCPSAASR
jgi:hypothetical protein